MNKSNQFCQDILDLDIARSGAVASLVMALSSCETANHPVELSESDLFTRKYHSVYRGIQDLAKDSESYEKVSKSVRDLCLKYSGLENDCYDLQTDVTPVRKPHSACLKDRMYVDVPNNVVASNASIDKGYKYSYVNLSLNQPSYSELAQAYKKPSNTKWTAPVSISRVDIEDTPSQTAVSQLNTLFLDEQAPFKDADLVCNTLDSGYGNSAYISSVHHHENLVNIVRLRSSMRIYPEDRQAETGGAPRIYGKCHYLIEESGIHHYTRKGEKKEKYRDSVLDLAYREKLVFLTETKKGKVLRVHVKRINNVMLRSTNEYNMKDKPFDLLYVRVFDQAKQKPMFKPMWLAITGQKRGQINAFQAYCKYSHRYDIEPFFRFSKQKLLLDKYQTSSVEYLDNWVLIVQMAAWLLWTASNEAEKNPKPWQVYLPEYKNKDAAIKQPDQASEVEQLAKEDIVSKQPDQASKVERLVKDRLTIAQTRKGANTLFSTFDKKPFVSQKSNKGKGRKKGTKLTPKKRYKVVKKGQNLVQQRKT